MISRTVAPGTVAAGRFPAPAKWRNNEIEIAAGRRDRGLRAEGFFAALAHFFFAFLSLWAGGGLAFGQSAESAQSADSPLLDVRCPPARGGKNCPFAKTVREALEDLNAAEVLRDAHAREQRATNHESRAASHEPQPWMFVIAGDEEWRRALDAYWPAGTAAPPRAFSSLRARRTWLRQSAFERTAPLADLYEALAHELGHIVCAAERPARFDEACANTAANKLRAAAEAK